MWWRDKSYEVLPALSVRRQNLRTSLRTVTVAWMYGVVWMSCISGDQMRAFCRMLGFNDFAFGLLAAIPFLATFGQLPAAIIVERTGLRKYLFLYSATTHRLLYIVVAMVPLLLPIPGLSAVTAMLVVLGVSNFLGAFATAPWWTWMGDLIPRRIRGRYFARRSQWTQAVQIVVVIALSIVLDAVTRPGATTAVNQPALLAVICIAFALAGLFGATDILLFLRLREMMPTTHHEPRKPAVDIHVGAARRPGVVGTAVHTVRYMRAAFLQLLVEPMQDGVFANYVLYGATITFTMSVSGWYFWLFSTEGLGFSKLGANLLFLVIGPVTGILSASFWGKLIDRWGRRPALILATVGTTLSMFPWFFATKSTPAPQAVVDAINWTSRHIGAMLGHSEWRWVGDATPLGAYLLAMSACIIGGASWNGVNLAQTGVILNFSDGHGRSKYVAASSVLISMGGALGGLIGGVIAQSLSHLQQAPIVLGPFIWNNWHATFLVSLVIRAVSIAWLVKMPDPGARAVRAIVRDWSTNVYNVVLERLFYHLRIFGWGGSQRRPSRRMQDTPGSDNDAATP